MKEYAIAASYKEEKQLWDQATFPLSKHSKDAIDRGYILGSIDELTQALDESILKLQSMSSSQ